MERILLLTLGFGMFGSGPKTFRGWRLPARER